MYIVCLVKFKEKILLEQIKASLAIENLYLSEYELTLLKEFEQGHINIQELTSIILDNTKEQKVA